MQTLKLSFLAPIQIAAEHTRPAANQNKNPKIIRFTSTTRMKKHVDTDLRACELRMLDQALAGLAIATAKKRKRDIWEWRDDLEVMVLRTQHTDIRERAQQALAS